MHTFQNEATSSCERQDTLFAAFVWCFTAYKYGGLPGHPWLKSFRGVLAQSLLHKLSKQEVRLFTRSWIVLANI